MKKTVILIAVLIFLSASYFGYKSFSKLAFYKNRTVISALSGKVVTININKEIEELAVNDELFTDEILITEKDSYADIHFQDDSLVRLKKESKLAIKALPTLEDPIVKLKLLEGKALFNIRKSSDKIKFKVNTINSLVGVKGTEFSVDFNLAELNTTVKVLEGEVQTLNKKYPDKIVDLKSGEKLDLPGLSEPKAPEKMSEEERQELQDINDISTADVKTIAGSMKESITELPAFITDMLSKNSAEGTTEVAPEDKSDAAAKMQEIRNEIKNLQLDVIDYAASSGKLPQSITDLQVEENIKKDPWGNYYQILPNDQTLLIYSSGPDGKPGTTDDIKF